MFHAGNRIILPCAGRRDQMAKATGSGGVFFKVADPAATRAWYADHLGR